MNREDDITREGLTNRYNANYRRSLSKKELACLEIIKNSPYPLTPKEVAKRAKTNPNSVRVYLKGLKDKGFVTCPFRGHYESVKNIVTQDGVGLLDGGVLRCHKLMFVTRGAREFALGKRVVRETDLFRVLSIGYSNGTMCVHVACKGSYSFDYGAFLCLLELIKHDLGLEDDESMMVKTIEWNNDFKGVQLDGIKAVTLKDVKGVFERLYNKDSRTLRSEANLQQPLSIEAAYTLLKGGITPYNIFQSSFMLVQENRKILEAVKFGNRTLSECLAVWKDLVEKLLKGGETTEKQSLS